MFLNSAEAWQLLFICAGVVAGFLLCAHLINLKKNIPVLQLDWGNRYLWRSISFPPAHRAQLWFR